MTRRASEPDDPGFSAGSILSDWYESLEEYAVKAVLVLGPDRSSPDNTREVVAVYPDVEMAPATLLARSPSYGAAWRDNSASLVAWKNLSVGSSGDEIWVSEWLARGAKALVRVELPLPFNRAFESYSFTGRALADRNEAATIAWSALNVWPVLREKFNADRFEISAREREILMLLAAGKTAKEAAVIVNCTERTVTFHLTNLKEKLGAENKASVIQRACSLGVI